VKRTRTLALIATAIVCGGCTSNAAGARTTVRFWAFGREGEVVQQLVPEFERRNPGVHIEVQQIPWTAAHEKLLTAFVGGATPDVAQMGNTWVPELSAIGALEPLDSLVRQSASVVPAGFFPGIWATNVVGNVAYGIPWYVDTRLLFYRTDLLHRAGYDHPPATWTEWLAQMRAVKKLGGTTEYAILLPLDEWAQPVILGLQNGSTLLTPDGRRGAFRQAPFRDALQTYVSLFTEGLAPAVANTQISSVYQEFARGRFAFYITGPWNIGEFQHRLPPEMKGKWATAPMPGPGGAEHGVSIAGGSSVVVFHGSTQKAAAWRFVEYLAEPAVQLRFYELTGDLPARIETWEAPVLASDENLRSFGVQLRRTVPLPQVPECELIVQRVAQYAEQAARGKMTVDAAVAGLDAEVDRTLEKRRWMLDEAAVARGASAVPDESRR
jgi:multiple sugar transport system substrate-binding protein